MYVVYNEVGFITGTIMGPDKTYGPEVLDKSGQKWVFLESTSSLDPRVNYVDVETNEVKPSEPMQLVADKVSIKPDGEDVATITGIPLQASVSVFLNDALQIQQTMVDDKLEISAASPATYRVAVTCWKYLPTELVITAA